MSVRANVNRFATVDNLLTATVVLAETLRVYPWLVFIGALSFAGWTAPPLSLLSALIILGATAFLVSMTLSRGLHLSELRLATLGLGIILILLFLRLENGGGYSVWDPAWFGYAGRTALPLIVGLGFGFLLLWRGITVGREELRTDYLYRNFLIGIVTFLLLTLFWAAALGLDAGRRLFASLVPYVIGYFFTALMGLGIANFLSLRKGMGARPKATDLFARRWLLLLLGVVLVIVVIGTLAASGLSLNLVTLIMEPLNTAASWLATGFLYLVGYPLGFLAQGMEWLIGVVVRWLQGFGALTSFDQLQLGDLSDFGEELKTGQAPEGLFLIVKWVLFIAVVSVVIFFLWRALYRYWKGPNDKGYEEINESLWGNFGADLKSFLRDLAGRLQRRGAGHAVPPIAVTMTDAGRLLDIRELYRGLLWVGAESGYPKAVEQTPYEYESVLSSAIPETPFREALSQITLAYVADRYGHAPAENERARALVQTWFSLRSRLRRAEQRTVD